MSTMTSHERFTRMFEHREADRIPIIDYPWGATIERWQSEGLPTDISYVDYLGLDKVATISVDNSPQYEIKVIEETDDYIIATTPWGATEKNFKHAASTPGMIDFRIKSPQAWQEAKQRMVPSRDRIKLDYLKANYKHWREDGYWIEGSGWFGFDVTHAHMVGTDRLLVAMIEDPEWCLDMFYHYQDVNLALLDMVWDAGYKFDVLCWPDDMGYKYNQFFSLKTYRELLKPLHKSAIDWAHAKGIKAYLHSCGNIMPFIPELVEIGLDALNPLEVKAGMDPIGLKKEFGDDLVLHGGINAVLYSDIEAMEAEIRRVVPKMKENGGYIFASDHSVPSSVSLRDFQRIIELARQLGSY